MSRFPAPARRPPRRSQPPAGQPPARTLSPRVLAAAMLVLILGLASATALLVTGLAREARTLSPTVSDVRLWLSGDDEPAGTDSQPRRFTVQRGETASQIAERLQEDGLVPSALAFRLRARSEGLDVNFQAGDYDLAPSMRPTEIMEALQHGRLAGRALTIPEGWRLAEIADQVEAMRPGSRAEFLQLALAGRGDLPAQADRPQGSSLEGYLFPDTYQLDADTSMQTLLDAMLRNFQQKVGPEHIARARAKGLSVHQLVTIASIVEREARVPAERTLIAAVYLNRQRQNMLLQADPTVQYALHPSNAGAGEGGYWRGVLTGADLRVDSPYNTYQRRGLPPGPICSPGLGSIDAVLDAGPSDLLYFVARPDGSHLFATTLAEHSANVAKVGGQ
ncbi:MAG TPA: endolytic transglycosylase MltG [Chloroflexota bacterium]